MQKQALSPLASEVELSQNRTARNSGWVQDYSKLARGPNGRVLCRRCSTEVPAGRRTFCSNECVHEWRLRTDPGYLRHQTFHRDKGVCAKCGKQSRCDWQADHIVPVVEGGGECGLENIRTLCTPCHKEETAALRKRLTAKRNPPAPSLFDATATQEVLEFKP